MSKSSTALHSFGWWTLLALAAILPIGVLTGSGVPSLMTKVMIGGVFVLLSVVFFAIAHMRSQELLIPRSLILASAWLLPVSYLLSTLFGGGDTHPFFGERLSMDSFGFILIAILALTVTAITLNTPKKALGLYLAMLVSATVLTFAELVVFFARGDILPFGLQSVSLVGSLNDLGIYFGLITVFALLSLILLPLNQLMRAVLWFVLIAATLFLMIVNLTALWWIIGAFALSFFVFTVSEMYGNKKGAYGEISYAALMVLLIAVLFIFVPAKHDDGTATITGLLAEKANVGEYDVRPSWGTTVSIGSKAYEKHGAFLGSGPGTFYHNWAQFMPENINVTAFWLTDFFYGIGLVPTSVVTTGLLGAFSWILFFGVFLWRGTRGLLLSGNTKKGDVIGYLRVTSFVAALYLWINTVIQVPSPVLVFYAVLLTGVFIASLAYGTDVTNHIKISFKANPRIGFLATLVLTLLLIGSLGGMVSLVSRYSAEASFQKAVVAYASEGDLNKARAAVVDALNSNKVDVYYRLLSNIDVRRIEKKLAENLPPEEAKVELEGLLSSAIANAMQATNLDKRDYQNWLNLGAVYQSTASLGINGVIESAESAYNTTLEYRPSSPSVYYSKAVLARLQGDSVLAREYVQKAITLRNQYTDAIFLLAQIQIEESEVEKAIKSVEAITMFNPGNAVAFFQLGLLHYSLDDFVSAVQTFERAVSISPQYANARYFLGLSNWKLGDIATALSHFEKVAETNPDNQDVAIIIKNLESGKDPFAHLEEAPSIENIGLPVDVAGDGGPERMLRPEVDELAQ